MEQWRGRIDAKLSEHERRLNVINGDAAAARRASEETREDLSAMKASLLAEIASLRTDTKVELTTLRIKVALGATIGSLIGAAIVSAVIAIIARSIG